MGKLREVLDKILADSMKFQQSRLKKGEQMNLNVVHVTDILKCEEKLRLFSENPEEGAKISIIPAVLLGKTSHIGFGELTGLPENRLEVEYSKRVGIYAVFGHCDYVYDDCIVELKTSVWKKADSGPRDQDLLQGAIYYWMSGKPVFLWYLSANSIVEFEIKNPCTDEEVLGLIENRESPRWDFECRYCSFRKDDCTVIKEMKLKGKNSLPKTSLRGGSDEKTESN